MKYCWSATKYEADADKVGRELEIIEERKELTREAVVEYARDKNSELHKCFEWDDEVAGEKYRLYQASNILTSISIVMSEEPQKSTRLFVNIKTDNDKREYKNIIAVLENEDEYQQLLDKAEKDFLSYKDRWENLIELRDFKNIIYKNM